MTLKITGTTEEITAFLNEIGEKSILMNLEDLDTGEEETKDD